MPYKYSTIILFLALQLAVPKGYGQSPCDPSVMTDSAEILFDGPVNKMAVNGHFMYAGGDFHTVGKYCGNFIELNRSTGAAVNRRLWPKINGNANAIADGFGNLVLFGSFTKVGDSVRNGLAIITTAGQISPFNVSLNGVVNTAAILNGILYIGGYFTQVNTVTRNRLAAINISTGAVQPWNPNVTNSGPLQCRIEHLLVANGQIYAGGAFSHIGAITRKNIASIDIATGLANAWNPEAYFSTAPTYGTVARMLRVGNLLYICGQFDFAGGAAHGDVAAIDLTTGSATSWAPNPNSIVTALANKGDTLYVGGAFSQISSQPRRGFAAYSVTTGNLLGITINTAKSSSEYISAIAVLGDTLFIGGLFDTINSQLRKNIAAFSRLDGTILAFKSYTDGEVKNILYEYGRLYAGGDFISVDRKQKNYLVSIDMDVDTVMNGTIEPDGEVKTINVRNNTVYIAGNFTKIKDSARLFNAALDKQLSNVLPWYPRANGIIKDIELYKGDMYIGGDFSMVNGQPRNGLARLDLAGTLHPWTAIAGSGSKVNALEILKDSLYVGGVFHDLGGQPRNSIGAIDLTTGLANPWQRWQALPHDTLRGWNLEVRTMQLLGDTLYSAGLYNKPVPVYSAPSGFPPAWVLLSLTYVPTEQIHGYALNTSRDTSFLDWEVYPEFDDAVNDIYVERIQGVTDKRGYVAGAFNLVNGQPQALSCILNIPSNSTPLPGRLPPSPRSKQMFPDVTIGSLTEKFNVGNLSSICRYNNKMFLAGGTTKRASGYTNAVLFYIPYIIANADISCDSTVLCAGTKTIVYANSTVSYGSSYQWMLNGSNISNTLPYYKFAPKDKDSLSFIVSAPANGCLPAWTDTSNSIVFTAMPIVTPVISIAGPAEEKAGEQVTVRAMVVNAADHYSIEWFNKGISMGKTTVDSITYTKSLGTDSIYAVITPRTDTCYVTDTSALITINEKPEGISNVNGDAGITVYPNPFDKIIRISGLQEGDVLLLYDITGRKIMADEYHAQSKDYTIASGYLKPGTYVLKITDRHGVSRKNVLIQKQ